MIDSIGMQSGQTSRYGEEVLRNHGIEDPDGEDPAGTESLALLLGALGDPAEALSEQAPCNREEPIGWSEGLSGHATLVPASVAAIAAGPVDAGASGQAVEDGEHWLLSMHRQRSVSIQVNEARGGVQGVVAETPNGSRGQAALPQGRDDHPVVEGRQPEQQEVRTMNGPAGLIDGVDTVEGGQSDRPRQATPAMIVADQAPLPPSQAMRSGGTVVGTVLQQQSADADWGERLMQTLRSQVELQVQQRVQQANIRLDPEELGSLDIRLSHEHGRLSVQITAGQGDVAKWLSLESERLRQELMDQSYTHVSVHVRSDADQGQGGRQNAPARGDDDVLISHASVKGESDANHRPPDDVLITV